MRIEWHLIVCRERWYNIRLDQNVYLNLFLDELLLCCLPPINWIAHLLHDFASLEAHSIVTTDRSEVLILKCRFHYYEWKPCIDGGHSILLKSAVIKSYLLSCNSHDNNAKSILIICVPLALFGPSSQPIFRLIFQDVGFFYRSCSLKWCIGLGLWWTAK